MNISGLVVTTVPEQTEDLSARLPALPGIEVHGSHAGSGRLVVVLETPDDEGFESSVRLLRGQPGVLGVELAYHWVDRGMETVPAAPGSAS